MLKVKILRDTNDCFLECTNMTIVHVIVPDVMADNGIFHGVDGIILPNSFTPCHGDGPTVPTDITSAAAAAGQSSLFARIAVASTAMLLLL